MVNVPQKLFAKATSCGLRCTASEKGRHRIEPYDEPSPWCLAYEKGNWVLIVGELPQIRFRYDEVVKFLERFRMKKVAVDSLIKQVPDTAKK